MLPLLGWLLRGARAEHYGLIILSLLVGHTAWHWLLDRAEDLSAVAPPAFDGTTLLLWLAGLSALILLLQNVRPGSEQTGPRYGPAGAAD